MAFALGPKASAAGYRLAAYDSVGSTSSEALARAALGDEGRLWIVAREQTAGHGRRGRNWQTPAGNLAASLLIAHAKDAGASATLGFAAGLALECAIRSAAGGLHPLAQSAGIRLKWPNDVLCGGAKVAGILLEGAKAPSGRNAVVIGIGVNVNHAPEGVPYPATSLARCGFRVSAEDLFAALAEAWVDHERLWTDGGFAALRGRWLERAAGLGSPIAVKVGDEVLRGTFETIDDAGRLIVRGADGSSRQITAGEVHFGAVATAC